MIIINKGELTVVGNRAEVGAEGVAIFAYLYHRGMLEPCLKLFEEMLENETINKFFEDEED